MKPLHIFMGVLMLWTGLWWIAVIFDKNEIRKIEFPEEISQATKGDTLTYEVIDNIAVIEFYHGYTNQKNKQLIIVK